MFPPGCQTVTTFFSVFNEAAVSCQYTTRQRTHIQLDCDIVDDGGQNLMQDNKFASHTFFGGHMGVNC